MVNGIQVTLNIRTFFLNEPSMPSARNSISNILTRANLNRRWWVNDPDCLLVRPDTRLTLDEVRSLATVIALTGGSLLLSDDLPALPPERMKIAEVLLPVMEEEVRVLDWFDAGMPNKLRVDIVSGTDSWHILGWFNWSDKPAALRIELSAYDAGRRGIYLPRVLEREDRHLRYYRPACGSEMPRRMAVYCWRCAGCSRAGRSTWAAICISHRVTRWRIGVKMQHSLEMTLRLPRTAAGKVFLKLPFVPASVMMNGNGLMPAGG